MKAIMARQNIGVADDGRLQLQDFGNISDLVRNIKNNKKYRIDDLLVLIDEEKDKQYLIPINKKAQYIRLSNGTIDYDSDIEDFYIDNFEVDGEVVEYEDSQKVRIPLKRDDDDAISSRRRGDRNGNDGSDYIFPESNLAALELLESYSELYMAKDPATRRQYQTYVSQLKDGKLTEKSMNALLGMLGVKKFTGFYIEGTGHVFLPDMASKILSRREKRDRERSRERDGR